MFNRGSFFKTTEISIDNARTLPRQYYTSPELFSEELEMIFTKRWLCVGREDQIPSAGDWFRQEIGKESIIILRDREGRCRAYHNICRHRGTRICQEQSGQFAGRIQCPYHAWTYGLDGRLVGAPATQGLENFRSADWPLLPVAVATWEGFLFINLAANPEPFAQAWAPLLGRFSRFNLPNLKLARTIEYDVRANWKLIFQNYSECYHCGPLHPALAKLSPPTSGENDLIEGQFSGGFMALSRGAKSLTMSGQPCGVAVGELPEEDLYRVYYYVLFPAMLLSLHPDYVMFHTIWPQAKDRTLIRCSWLFHPATLGDPAFKPDDGIEFWDMTNKQDWHICEQGQLGVESRAYTPGPYTPRESLVVQFDREVLRSLGHVRK